MVVTGVLKLAGGKVKRPGGICGGLEGKLKIQGG